MILNKNRLFVIASIALLGVLGASCVDIPASAPPTPEFYSEYRFITVAPDNATPTATSFEIADAPFTTYRTIAIPANTIPSPSEYQRFLAGAKKIIHFNGFQKDTFSVTFDTDQRGTLAFYRTAKKTTDTIAQGKGLFDILKLPYRYIFAPNGLKDTTQIRFINLINGIRTVDTMNILQKKRPEESLDLLVDNKPFLKLAFGKVSSTGIKISIGSSIKYLITTTKYDSLGIAKTVEKIFKDTLTFTGVSNKVYSVFIYNQYDTLAATSDAKIANVKFFQLEEK